LIDALAANAALVGLALMAKGVELMDAPFGVAARNITRGAEEMLAPLVPVRWRERYRIAPEQPHPGSVCHALTTRALSATIGKWRKAADAIREFLQGDRVPKLDKAAFRQCLAEIAPRWLEHARVAQHIRDQKDAAYRLVEEIANGFMEKVRGLLGEPNGVLDAHRGAVQLAIKVLPHKLPLSPH
jgi:hypothetical protein